jgi:hypothetical protein
MSEELNQQTGGDPIVGDREWSLSAYAKFSEAISNEIHSLETAYTERCESWQRRRTAIGVLVEEATELYGDDLVEIGLIAAYEEDPLMHPVDIKAIIRRFVQQKLNAAPLED